MIEQLPQRAGLPAKIRLPNAPSPMHPQTSFPKPRLVALSREGQEHKSILKTFLEQSSDSCSYEIECIERVENSAFEILFQAG